MTVRYRLLQYKVLAFRAMETHSFQAFGVVGFGLDAMDRVDGVEADHEDQQDGNIDKVAQTLLREGEHNLQCHRDYRHVLVV